MQQIFVQADGKATWNLDGECESAELPVFIINPESDKSQAAQDVKNAVPATFEGLPLSKIQFDSYDSEGNINMIAIYEKETVQSSESNEDNAPTLSFNCNAVSLHIDEAYSNTTIVGSLDAGKSIGWNGKTGDEAEFAGVDIQTGEMRETYTKVMRYTAITTDYKKKLRKLIGKVNKSSFKGWDAGEVMFMGASFSTPTKGQENVTVSFEFNVQPHENSVKIFGQTVNKKGFEYVWAIRETRVEENSLPKVIIKGAYKSVVVQSADFSVLGLGK